MRQYSIGNMLGADQPLDKYYQRETGLKILTDNDDAPNLGRVFGLVNAFIDSAYAEAINGGVVFLPREGRFPSQNTLIGVSITPVESIVVPYPAYEVAVVRWIEEQLHFQEVNSHMENVRYFTRN